MTMEEQEWRKLCKQVADETDPRRLSRLIDDLIKALDARKHELHKSGPQPNHGGSH
jgi:hypothetical protein